MREADRQSALTSAADSVVFARRGALQSSVPHRLWLYQGWIRSGWAIDLGDAVRAVAEARLRNRVDPRHEWDRKVRYRSSKRFRLLRALVLAGDQPCHYCGGPATAVDHVLAVARGGQDCIGNLVPACNPCNSEKWKWTVAEWRAWREARGRPWPPSWPSESPRSPTEQHGPDPAQRARAAADEAMALAEVPPPIAAPLPRPAPPADPARPDPAPDQVGRHSQARREQEPGPAVEVIVPGEGEPQQRPGEQLNHAGTAGTPAPTTAARTSAPATRPAGFRGGR